MANITVTPEQLQDTANRLLAGAASIEQTLGELTSNVAPLRSEWRGDAQAQFEMLWDQWHRSGRDLNDALNGIARLTQQAGVHYADTEGAIKSSFGQ